MICNLTSGYISEGHEISLSQRIIYTSMFIAALFTITKAWKQPKCPSTDEQIKMIYKIYMYIYLNIMQP